jgi:hypothetical protein
VCFERIFQVAFEDRKQFSKHSQTRDNKLRQSRLVFSWGKRKVFLSLSQPTKKTCAQSSSRAPFFVLLRAAQNLFYIAGNVGIL